MNTHDRAVAALEPYALNGNLCSIVQVQRFERSLGTWVCEASGSSVAWLAAAADDEADFGRVRIVAIGEVLFDTAGHERGTADW